ncbi:MAG: bifunctional metallophosphatase/5'-nucleotidase [Bifidobacteriaceae bacterium]|jgi:5'-nucleotidase|nr:bifunctional metallophosphatase/5'-nucleotidase [Bifidobacteriaceae bacterium]
MRKAFYFLFALSLFISPSFFICGQSFADGATQTINILDINDYHGRITGDYAGSKPTNDATWLFADLVASQKAQNQDGTIFTSGGDNISGSLFTSFIQQDNPTIDMLNAAGLDVSVVGNHEFDKGTDDLKNRVIPRAQWTYLADNVYKKGTTEPYFPNNLYKVIEKKGVKIGFVGSVTKETATSVSPDKIKDVDFGDPVAAVNKEAKYLKDNNLADVVIALYHEGANCSSFQSEGAGYCSSIDDAKKKFPVFSDIVDNTSPDIAAIIMGHTHQRYVWQDAPHNNRVVIQTGCYGADIGNIALNIDDSSKSVLSSSGQLIFKKQFTTPIDSSEYAAYRNNSLSTYQSVQNVADISDDAQEYADRVGLEPIAALPQNITRSYLGCPWINGIYKCDLAKVEESRGDESSIGSLVANAYKDYVNENTQYKIDLSVVNPGSLRTDAIPNSNGKFTYGNAESIQPFANELFNIKMTGAQLKELVEEQWQTDSSGQRPGRPFLGLSFSNGFTYTVNTFNPMANPGNHVLDISLNDKKIDMNKVYNVLTTSFLASGGDNFREFTSSENQDVGLVDSDVFAQFIKQKGPNNKIYPSFSRSGVVANNKLNENYKTSDKIHQTISYLDMFSDGFKQNERLDIYIDDEKIGSSKVTNPVNLQAAEYSDKNAGYSDIDVQIPNNIATGEHLIKYIAEPSKTSISQFAHIQNVAPTPAPYPNTGLSDLQIYLVIMLLLSSSAVFILFNKKLV